MTLTQDHRAATGAARQKTFFAILNYLAPADVCRNSKPSSSCDHQLQMSPKPGRTARQAICIILADCKWIANTSAMDLGPAPARMLEWS